VDEMVLDLQIFVEEIGWPRIVRFDSADFRGGNEDKLGLFSRKEFIDRCPVHEIKFGVGFAEESLEALALQFPPDGTAGQPAMAGYVNPSVLRHWHSDSLGWIAHGFQGSQRFRCWAVTGRPRHAALSPTMNRQATEGSVYSMLDDLALFATGCPFLDNATAGKVSEE